MSTLSGHERESASAAPDSEEKHAQVGHEAVLAQRGEGVRGVARGGEGARPFLTGGFVGAFGLRTAAGRLEQDAAHPGQGEIAPAVVRSEQDFVAFRGERRGQRAETPGEVVCTEKDTHA